MKRHTIQARTDSDGKLRKKKTRIFTVRDLSESDALSFHYTDSGAEEK